MGAMQPICGDRKPTCRHFGAMSGCGCRSGWTTGKFRGYLMKSRRYWVQRGLPPWVLRVGFPGMTPAALVLLLRYVRKTGAGGEGEPEAVA